jgi:hypothetical protein
MAVREGTAQGFCRNGHMREQRPSDGDSAAIVHHGGERFRRAVVPCAAGTLDEPLLADYHEWLADVKTWARTTQFRAARAAAEQWATG